MVGRRAWARSSIVGVVAVMASAAGAAARAQEKVTYDDQVGRLLTQHCGKCHGPERMRAGLDVTTYAGVLKGSSGGVVVEAGDPDGSVLYLAITHQREPTMPPGNGKLADPVIATLRAWIAGGLLESAGSQAKPKKKSRLAPIAAGAADRPTEPLPLPDHLSLEPAVVTARPGALGAMAASPWSPVLALGGQKQVLLYDTRTFAPLGVLPFPEGQPCALAFSRDGRLLIAGGGHGGASGRAVAWNVADGERVLEAADEPDVLLAADLSADRSLVAFGGPQRVVKVVDAGGGATRHVVKKHTEWVTALRFSPDGVLWASGDRNGGLAVFEAQSGREMHTLVGHAAAITAVAWRDDSNVLASASEDGTVKLWEMFEGRQIASFAAHGGGVLALAMAHDGRLATGGRDRAAKLWSAEGQPQKSFELGALVTGVAFDDEGTRLFTGDARGEVVAWNVGDGARLATLALAPPTIAQRLQESEATLAAALQQESAAATAQQSAEQAVVAPLAAVASARELEEQRRAAAAPFEAALAQARGASEQSAALLAAAEARLGEQRSAQQSRAEATQAATRSVEEARAAIEPAARARDEQATLAARLAESAAAVAAQSAAAPDEARWQEAAARANEAATLAQQAAQAAADRHAALLATVDAGEREIARIAAEGQAGGDALAAAEAARTAASGERDARESERAAAEAAGAAPRAALDEATAASAAAVAAARPLEEALTARRAEAAAASAARSTAERDVARWRSADLDRQLAELKGQRRAIESDLDRSAAAVTAATASASDVATRLAAAELRSAAAPQRSEARAKEQQEALRREESLRGEVHATAARHEQKSRTHRELAARATELQSAAAGLPPDAPLAQAAAKMGEAVEALARDVAEAATAITAAQGAVREQLAAIEALGRRHAEEVAAEAALPGQIEALRQERVTVEAAAAAARSAHAILEQSLVPLDERRTSLVAERDRLEAAARS